MMRVIDYKNNMLISDKSKIEKMLQALCNGNVITNKEAYIRWGILGSYREYIYRLRKRYPWLPIVTEMVGKPGENAHAIHYIDVVSLNREEIPPDFKYGVQLRRLITTFWK